MQTWKRRLSPFSVSFFVWTFARKTRLVRGAFRCQRPELLWRMFRPKAVPLPHSSHFVAIAR